MNRATATTPPLAREHDAAGSWTNEIKAHTATYFTAEMLHRTSEGESASPTVWSVDHFALERMARAMRRDHVAGMVYAAQLGIAKLASAIFGVIGAVLTPVTAAIATRLEALAGRSAAWQRHRREAYLGEAIDVYDLERRMRDMERRDHRSFG